MQYSGCLISVSNIEKSRNFYEKVLGQKVLMDIGVHVSFEGFSLQSNYEELVGVKLNPKKRPDTFQLYFEVENLEDWHAKLKAIEGIEFLHGIKEYPWGQRGIRFYDYDNYIIEVSETMESVAKRYLAQGLSVEETAERTMYPIAFVKGLL